MQIDGLWVKYSQGKFGFSVQKEIIKKCGYKLDGRDPRIEVWDDFCYEVGWRDKKTKEWQVPTYILDINTNIGTLPSVGAQWEMLRFSRIAVHVGLGSGGWVVWVFSSLASRLVDCSR